MIDLLDLFVGGVKKKSIIKIKKNNLAQGKTSQQDVKLIKDLAKHEVLKVLKKCMKNLKVPNHTVTLKVMFEICVDKLSGLFIEEICEGKFFKIIGYK